MAKHYLQLSSEELDRKLGTHLHDLGLSPSAVGTLDQHGIYNLNDLLSCTRQDLLDMKNFSNKSVQNILDIIRNHGFY